MTKGSALPYAASGAGVLRSSEHAQRAAPTRELALIGQEYALTSEDFARICALAHRYAGIVLGPNRQQMVYSRLRPRVRARGMTSFAEYLGLLHSPGSAELQEFVNALTTNLTFFFRETHHFPILAQHVADKRFTHPHRMVWCAGCSTGQEAYSIAMTLVETFNTFNPPVKVLATDIDTSVLQQAEQGVYPLAQLRELPQHQIDRFFVVERGGGFATVRPELRKLVVFRPINLLDASWPIRPPLDAIFCRNVMIYFDKTTQERVLRKFAPLMHEEGLLFVGHSESYGRLTDVFCGRGATVYNLTGIGKELARQTRSHWRPAGPYQPPNASSVARAKP